MDRAFPDEVVVGVVPASADLASAAERGVASKQVLDLWRSVLDGMPIGLFYVQAARPWVVDREAPTELTRAPEGAFDLFDGQQRIRALALGAGDPLRVSRCIWVRFEDEIFAETRSGRRYKLGREFEPLDVRAEGVEAGLAFEIRSADWSSAVQALHELDRMWVAASKVARHLGLKEPGQSERAIKDFMARDPKLYVALRRARSAGRPV